MLLVEIHFNITSSISYKIKEEDLKNIYYKNWWKKYIKKEILILSKELQKSLESKNSFFFYDFKRISNDIQFKSKLLEEFYISSQKKIILFEDENKNVYQSKNISKKYKIYLSENEYINEKKYFIYNELSYNNQIKFEPILQEYLYSGFLEKKERFLTNKVIKELEKFNYSNITLDFSKKNQKLLEDIDNQEVLKIITKIRKLKINEKIQINENILKKIESIFQSNKLLDNKNFGYKIEMKKYILYYETIYKKNDVLFIYNKDTKEIKTYNSNIGNFIDLFFYLKEGNNINNIEFPLFEILDQNKKNHVLTYLN